MHKNKLIQLLAGLDVDEMNRLSKFVKSPFYNTNPSQVKFYDLLKTAYPSFDQPKLKKERVFKRLFPDKAFNYAVFGNLVSGMVQIVDKYLVALQLEKQELVRKRLMVNSLAERPKCYGLFLKKVENMRKYMDGLPFRDARWYKEKYDLEQVYFNHRKTDKFKLKKEEYILSESNLDQSYVLEKILLNCDLKSRENIFGEKHDNWLIDEVKANFHKLRHAGFVLKTYRAMLSLIEEGNPKNYYLLKRIFIENVDKLSMNQKQNILQVLINYSIRKGNEGDAEFLAENLELTKLGLSYELLMFGGELNDLKYISIAIVALKNRATDWCLRFINEYENRLSENVRNDAKLLAMGLWLFDSDQPQKTVDLIYKVEFKNSFYQEQTKVLLLKSYFEIYRKDESYINTFSSQANSFERFVKRSTLISGARANRLLNFIWALKKISMLKYEENIAERKEDLRLKLMGMENFVSKAWALQKLEEID